MTRLLRPLAGFICSYHKPIAIVSLLLAVVSVFFIARLELKTDYLDVFPEGNENIAPFKEFIEEFGTTGSLIVVLESKSADLLAHTEMIEATARLLTESEKTRFVDYRIDGGEFGLLMKNFPLFLDAFALDMLESRLTKGGMQAAISKNKRTLLSPFTSPVDTELIATDPLGLFSIVRQGIFKDSPYGESGYYSTGDGKTLLMFVKPTHNARNLKALGEFTVELSRIKRVVTAKYGTGVTIGFTGSFAFAMEAHASLQRELLLTFTATAIAIFLLFQFVYRKRFTVLVVTGLCMLTALSYMLASAYLLFGALNLISSIVATMLIGLGIDYIIHSINNIEQEYNNSRDVRLALISTFERVMPGIVTGALTTAIAFLSIVITSFKGLHEMGITATIGVISNLFVTVFLLSALCVWFAPVLFRETKRRAGSGFTGLCSFSVRNRKAVIGVCLVLVCISLVLATGTKFDSDPRSFGQKNSQARKLFYKVSKVMKKARYPLIATFKADTREKLFNGYDILESKLKRLEQEETISEFSSLSFFIPTPSRQKAAIKRLSVIRENAGASLEENFFTSLKKSGFRVTDHYRAYIKGVKDAVALTEPLTLADLEATKNHRAEFFYNKENKKIAAYLYPPGAVKWQRSDIELATAAVREVGPGAVLTGVIIMFETLTDAIIKESVTSSVIAFVLISLLIYVNFRRFSWFLVILLPISVGFAFTLGLMRVFAIDFNFINIAAAPLIFGIGVDYGIYMVQGYKHGGVRELSGTSRTVVMCALTSVAGFGSLMTMSFRGLASIGAIITIGILSSVVVAIVVIPAVLSLLDKRVGERVDGEGDDSA